jgi:hypothetical protein
MGVVFWNLRSKYLLAEPVERFAPKGGVAITGVSLQSYRNQDRYHIEQIAPANVRPQNLFDAQRAKRFDR